MIEINIYLNFGHYDLINDREASRVVNETTMTSILASLPIAYEILTYHIPLFLNLNGSFLLYQL